MRWNFDGCRVAVAILELLHLLAKLLAALAQRVDLALLPVKHIAELLQRSFEVCNLHLERLDAVGVRHVR